jgi:ABC-type branched-subunit amino acid transport system substrate-binding protein
MRNYQRLSILSVVLTAIAITVNHIFTLGPGAFALGAVLVVLPALLMWWFTATNSKVALAGYLMMNLWIIVGFGLIKGLWDGVLRLFLGTLLSSVSSSYPRPEIGGYAFEASGILMFVGGVFVLYYVAKVLQAYRAERCGEAMLSIKPRTARAFAAIGATALVGVVGAYAYADRDRWTAPANGVVKIGVIVPTTGPYALLGGSFVKAVQMAADDLKHTKYRYQLVIRDSGPDPARARPVIEKVIKEDKVIAIVGGVSLIGQVTQPMARKARIPQTCVCTVSSIGDGVYNFTNIPSPEAEAIRWVGEARRRGISKIAIISQDYPSINNHVKALKAEAAKDGLLITYEHHFDAGTTDFRGTIAAAKATQPDVYYVEGLNPALEILGQRLLDAKIRNLSSVVAPSLSTKPELFEGVWYTDSNLRDIGFRKRFEDKYPRVQFATHMMPYAYDSFNMIVQAFEHGQNPAVYIRNLARYDGTADELVKDPGSGNFKSAPAVWMIRNGKPELIAAAR